MQLFVFMIERVIRVSRNEIVLLLKKLITRKIMKEINEPYLKDKDSFGKSENLSKIFFAEILVFDHDL